MSSPFVAEIRIFGGNFAPVGWATCDGQLLPLSQNTALFSLLGTFYGGDGQSTFALPNLQGRAPLGAGQGSGLSDRFIGESAGEQSVTLIESELPAHAHAIVGNSLTAGNQNDPTGRVLAKAFGGGSLYKNTLTGLVPMAPLGVTGASLPHNNMQPYLVFTFIIAMQGVFPPRG